MKSNSRLYAALKTLAAGLSPLFPFLSLLPQLATVNPSTLRRSALNAFWTCLPAAAVGLILLAFGRFTGAATFLGLSITIAAFVVFAGPRRQHVYAGTLGFTIAALIAVCFLFQADKSNWIVWGASESQILSGVFSGSTSVNGNWNSRVAAYRKWQVTDGSIPAEFTVRFRLTDGVPGAEWNSSEHLRVRITPKFQGESSLYSQLDFTHPSQFAFRSYSSADPLSSRSFESHLRIRSSDTNETCGTVNIVAHGDSGTVTSEHLCVSNNWQSVALNAVVPLDSNATQLDLVISGFDSTIDVSDVNLNELTGENAVSLLPLMPTGVTLRLSWNTKYPWDRRSGQEVTSSVIPNKAEDAISIKLPQLPKGTNIWGVLQVEDATTITLLGSEWTHDAVKTTNTIERTSLFYKHPNLFAHAVAASAIAALISAPTIIAALVPVLFASVIIIATGSRTALGALILATLVYLSASLLSLRQWQNFRLLFSIISILMIVVSAGLVYLWFESTRPSIVAPEGTLTASVNVRTQIWEFAWSKILEHPLLGVPSTFADSWITTHPNDLPVSHAHNGLLDATYRGGVLGAVAVVWTLISVVFLAGRRRPTSSLTVLAALVVLNLTDSTFLAPTVLAPLIYALQASEATGVQSNHGTARS